MRTSSSGRALIERFEGLVLHAYRDVAGILTIGYGHVVRPGDPIIVTQAEADALLSNDLRVAESAVNSCVTVVLEQYQFDALVSFTFNVGTGALVTSTLLRLLNAGDYQGAADQFLSWDHAMVHGVKTVVQGLLDRRTAERATFLDSTGPDTDPDIGTG